MKEPSCIEKTVLALSRGITREEALGHSLTSFLSFFFFFNNLQVSFLGKSLGKTLNNECILKKPKTSSC